MACVFFKIRRICPFDVFAESVKEMYQYEKRRWVAIVLLIIPFGLGSSRCSLPSCCAWFYLTRRLTGPLYWTRRHMWVEFVVGSRPRSEGFSPGSPVFLPPQKSTLLNSNSIWNCPTSYTRASGSDIEGNLIPRMDIKTVFTFTFTIGVSN